jgi:hypothetical protein
MVMTMKRAPNISNLDTTNKPLPVYKTMDNSMNSLTLFARERVNTNINPPKFITQVLPSITTIQPSIITSQTSAIIPQQSFMYGMLSNIQNSNTNCKSCGNSK